MFNLGIGELLVLGVIALLVIGPKQLPELARNIARMLNDLKRATNDFKGSFTETRRELEKTKEDLVSTVSKAETWARDQAKQIAESDKQKVQAQNKDTNTGSDA